MRLACPACQAEFSLDAAIGREADARAVATLLERHLVPGLGDVLVRYLALFRPASRRLSIARVVGLVQELAPDIERAAITRKGRDWTAPVPVWRAAIEHVLAMRDKGSLTLQLSGHGYLYEVIVGLSDKAEAVAEREQIDQARHRSVPPSVGMPAQVAQHIAAVPALNVPIAANPVALEAARQVRQRIALGAAANASARIKPASASTSTSTTPVNPTEDAHDSTPN